MTEPETGPKIISEIRFNDDVISENPFSPPGMMNLTFFDRQHAKVFVGGVKNPFSVHYGGFCTVS
jgi:hypothetical protein